MVEIYVIVAESLEVSHSADFENQPAYRIEMITAMYGTKKNPTGIDRGSS